MKKNISGISLLILSSLSLVNAQIKKETTWIANTFSGLNNISVESNLCQMHVFADGSVATNSPWSEGFNPMSIFKNGQLTAKMNQPDPWVDAGGFAVTGDNQYIYEATYNENPMKHNYVQRFFINGTPAPFPSSTNQVHIDAINSQDSALVGMTIWKNKLFLSNSYRIFVVDKTIQNGTQLYSWKVDRCKDIQADSSGNIWVIQRPDSVHPAKVLGYTEFGTLLPNQINGLDNPSALGLNKKKQLIVGDDGIRLQVLFYDVSSTPKIVDSLGLYGGVFKNTIPGKITDDRMLPDIEDVGSDSAGNNYVLFGPLNSMIRAYDKNKKLIWQVYGVTPQMVSDFDHTTDGTDIYSIFCKFKMDYSIHNAQGSKLDAITVNKYKYPDDPRLHFGFIFGSQVCIRYVQGKKLMYINYGDRMAIYRFDGEIAVPCGLYYLGYSSYPQKTAPMPPSGQPQWNCFWNDTNGDGNFQTNEWTHQNVLINPSEDWAFSVDENGTIWQGWRLKYFIVSYPITGFDTHGSPMYSLTTHTQQNTPNEIEDLMRLRYDAKNDIMYMAAYTTLYPKVTGEMWGDNGCAILRYDNWSTSPTLKYQFPLPYNAAQDSYGINEGFRGLEITDHYIVTAPMAEFPGSYPYITSFKDKGNIYLYDKETGLFADTLVYDKTQVGIFNSLMDIINPINAYERADGELVVLQEEVTYNKNTFYRYQKNVATDVSSQNKKTFELACYPNPSAGSLTIVMTENENNHVSIINSLGETVYSTLVNARTLLLNTENFACGLYHIIVENRNGRSAVAVSFIGKN